MAAWVETLVVALVGGGGVKTVEYLLAYRHRDTELARGLRKDEHEIGSKMRDELRRELETAKARAKEAEQTVEKLKEHPLEKPSTGKHPVVDVVSVERTLTGHSQSTKLEPPFHGEISEAEIALRQMIRAEVTAQLEEQHGVILRLRSEVEFLRRRLREEAAAARLGAPEDDG